MISEHPEFALDLRKYALKLRILKNFRIKQKPDNKIAIFWLNSAKQNT